MSEFVLILYIYAGMLAKGDSVSMQAVYGFKSEQECAAAGSKSSPLVSGSAKEIRFVCLKQEKR